jgi:glyoxylase-like metal-dependent hydrolase (beta-lactamase superfamily II)
LRDVTFRDSLLEMRKMADDLYLLRGFPPFAINVYLMGDVLVDAGTRFAVGRILRQLKGRTVRAHALTHAHPDHQGASHAVCEALGLPLWCGAADAPAAEDPQLIQARMPAHWISRNIARHLTGPGHPVARLLRAGDEVGGFTVLETPGHSAGHISFWRERDRALVLGDVLAHMSFSTGLPWLREPPDFFSTDPAQNRRSARAVAALEPALIAFGHGMPLRDTNRFLRFIAGLPD